MIRTANGGVNRLWNLEQLASGQKKGRPGAAPRLCRCTNQSVFPGYLTKEPIELDIQKNFQKKAREDSASAGLRRTDLKL